MADPDEDENFFVEDEPDDPDAWRDICDDPTWGEECYLAGTAYRI